MGPQRLEDYAGKYENIRLERDNGVLEVTLHTDGGELIYGMQTHVELAHVWRDLASDPETDVIIVTGTGDGFISKQDRSVELSGEPIDPLFWGGHILSEAKQAVMSQLDINVPMIGAINGPARMHPEIGILCDIVLASPNAWFQDPLHFTNGIVPGDGAHIIWPLMLGLNRARYFMLTGQKITAQEALEVGFVNEVLPQDQLMTRARELARLIQKTPPLTLRLTREVMLQNVKKLMIEGLGYGVALEGLAGTHFWPKDFPQEDD
jgi:enoyl-CoA hydratase/carnithine racemase